MSVSKVPTEATDSQVAGPKAQLPGCVLVAIVRAPYSIIVKP